MLATCSTVSVFTFSILLYPTTKEGEVIAKVYDVFGQVKEEIVADRSGIVIGKNIRPNCDAGTRILHLGVNIIEANTKNVPGHDNFQENS